MIVINNKEYVVFTPTLWIKSLIRNNKGDSVENTIFNVFSHFNKEKEFLTIHNKHDYKNINLKINYHYGDTDCIIMNLNKIRILFNTFYDLLNGSKINKVFKYINTRAKTNVVINNGLIFIEYYELGSYIRKNKLVGAILIEKNTSYLYKEYLRILCILDTFINMYNTFNKNDITKLVELYDSLDKEFRTNTLLMNNTIIVGDTNSWNSKVSYKTLRSKVLKNKIIDFFIDDLDLVVFSDKMNFTLRKPNEDFIKTQNDFLKEMMLKFINNNNKNIYELLQSEKDILFPIKRILPRISKR
jgi:hypothetical protein